MNGNSHIIVVYCWGVSYSYYDILFSRSPKRMPRAPHIGPSPCFCSEVESKMPTLCSLSKGASCEKDLKYILKEGLRFWGPLRTRLVVLWVGWKATELNWLNKLGL